MKQLAAILILLLFVLLGFWIVNDSTLERMRLQTELEQWRAFGQMASTANTLADVLVWVVIGLAVLVVMLLSAIVWLLLNNRSASRQVVIRPHVRTQELPLAPVQTPQLPAGDPIQQLVQLQVLKTLQEMGAGKDRLNGG